MVLATYGRQKVDKEAKHVPGVNERNDPFEYSGYVPVVILLSDPKDDTQTDLSDYEGELNPERDSEDRMLAVVDTQALIFPTNEDCADDVANNENSQANVVHPVVVVVVEDGEEDQTDCAYNRSNDAEQRVNLLPNRCVGCEFAGMTQVALEDEGKVKGHYGDRGHGNEHRFKGLCADICLR